MWAAACAGPSQVLGTRAGRDRAAQPRALRSELPPLAGLALGKPVEGGPQGSQQPPSRTPWHLPPWAGWGDAHDPSARLLICTVAHELAWRSPEASPPSQTTERRQTLPVSAYTVIKKLNLMQNECHGVRIVKRVRRVLGNARGAASDENAG